MKKWFNQISNSLAKATKNNTNQTSAGIIGGVGIGAVVVHRLYWSMDKEGNEIPATTEDCEELEILEKTVIHVAEPVHEASSFAEAFRQARAEQGPGAYFIWKEEAYNTFYKEEWETMSPASQQAFVENVVTGNAMTPDYEPIESRVLQERKEIRSTPAHLALNQEEEEDIIHIKDKQFADVYNDSQLEELLSIDDDSQAEIVISEERGEVYAYADTDNDGFLETFFTLNDFGNFVNPQPMPTKRLAPELEDDNEVMDGNYLVANNTTKGAETEQTIEKDLLHDDGKVDSLLKDYNDNQLADEWYVDFNDDQVYDKVFYDTNGDNRLDTVATLGPNGERHNEQAIKPFPAPSLEDTIGEYDIKGSEESTILKTKLGLEIGTEPGMSNEEDMDDW